MFQLPQRFQSFLPSSFLFLYYACLSVTAMVYAFGGGGGGVVNDDGGSAKKAIKTTV